MSISIGTPTVGDLTIQILKHTAIRKKNEEVTTYTRTKMVWKWVFHQQLGSKMGVSASLKTAVSAGLKTGEWHASSILAVVGKETTMTEDKGAANGWRRNRYVTCFEIGCCICFVNVWLTCFKDVAAGTKSTTTQRQTKRCRNRYVACSEIGCLICFVNGWLTYFKDVAARTNRQYSHSRQTKRGRNGYVACSENGCFICFVTHLILQIFCCRQSRSQRRHSGLSHVLKTGVAHVL